jgi:hypothetical protein
VLDWVSVYWFSRPGPAASLHIYYDNKHSPPENLDAYVRVPFGMSLFPREIEQPPLACVPPSIALCLYRVLINGVDKYMRHTMSCLSGSMHTVGTSQRTSSRSRWRTTCGQCSDVVGRHLALLRGKMGTEH